MINDKKSRWVLIFLPSGVIIFTSTVFYDYRPILGPLFGSMTQIAKQTMCLNVINDKTFRWVLKFLPSGVIIFTSTAFLCL